MSTRRPASRVPAPVPTENGSSGSSGSNGQRNSVVLGPADRLTGQLYIEGDLRVSGTVEGALEATGDIVISDGGKVNGQVTAYNRLVVGSAASLMGSDVRVGRLTVEDGATFSGHVTMGQQGKQAVERARDVEPEPAPAPVEVIAAEPEKPPVQQKGKRR